MLGKDSGDRPGPPDCEPSPPTDDFGLSCLPPVDEAPTDDLPSVDHYVNNSVLLVM
jgi:hypothetical protein